MTSTNTRCTGSNQMHTGNGRWMTTRYAATCAGCNTTRKTDNKTGHVLPHNA